VIDEHPESFIVRDATGQALGISAMAMTASALSQQAAHQG
jgi:hypothetical protein